VARAVPPWCSSTGPTRRTNPHLTRPTPDGLSAGSSIRRSMCPERRTLRHEITSVFWTGARQP
jgi:hypothetical protein